VFADEKASPTRNAVMHVTSFARRFRRYLHSLGLNPLVRASDRVEALALLALLAAAVFAVPLSADAGSLIYHAGARAADDQARDRHPVEAVALEGSAVFATEYDSTGFVRVQWREGATLRIEQINAPVTIKAGEPLTIWLDKTGQVVAAPLTTDDAMASALVAAVAVWVAVVFSCALLAFVIRATLDRARDRAWERELSLLTHNDDGWANRHTY
jgi:hypothetical protein